MNGNGFGQQGEVFCEFVVGDTKTLIVESVLGLMSVLLIVKGTVDFWRMRDVLNRHTMFVYVMTAIWWVGFIANILGELIIYALSKEETQKYDENYLSQLSKILWVVAWGDAFVIQGILLYVPYQWSMEILNLFEQLGRGIVRRTYSEEMEIESGDRRYKGLEKIVYQMLWWYIRIRVLFVSFPVFFMLISSTRIFFILGLYAFLLDCVVIAVALVLGIVSLKKTTQIKQIFDEDEISRMVNQYLLIVLASLFRFVFDAMVAANSVVSSSYQDKCPSDEIITIQDTILNSFATFSTHILPIFILLRMYQIQDRNEEVNKSLIITSQVEKKEPLIGSQK